MGSTNSGYFLVWRKIWKSPVFKNLKQCAIWIYMISQATHRDKTLNFLDNKIFVNPRWSLEEIANG